MNQYRIVIRNLLGINSRIAEILAEKAGAYQSSITLAKGKRRADLRHLGRVIDLNIRYGDEVTLIINGRDEEEAGADLLNYLEYP